MNGEEMKRLIADDEDRVLLLRFPKGWGLWVDLGGALLDEAFRSDLFFFEMNQEFWQEGDGWLKYPLPRSGRCTTLGVDYPPPTWGGLSSPWENSAPRADSPGKTPPAWAKGRADYPPLVGPDYLPPKVESFSLCSQIELQHFNTQ